MAGSAFGALALRIDTEAKSVIMPFEGLQMSPAERVAREQEAKGKQLAGKKGRFSAELMTHNTQVALLTMALGMTFGFGTIASLFYNGVILGAVAFDYVHGGQSIFLYGVAAAAWRDRDSRDPGGRADRVGDRVRADRMGQPHLPRGTSAGYFERCGDAGRRDVGDAGVGGNRRSVSLAVSRAGDSLWLKIAFGLVEAFLLVLFLARAGAKAE